MDTLLPVTASEGWGPGGAFQAVSEGPLKN